MTACARCNGDGFVERAMPATPDEVDEGWEFGVVFIDCPDCDTEPKEPAR